VPVGAVTLLLLARTGLRRIVRRPSIGPGRPPRSWRWARSPTEPSRPAPSAWRRPACWPVLAAVAGPVRIRHGGGVLADDGIGRLLDSLLRPAGRADRYAAPDRRRAVAHGVRAGGPGCCASLGLHLAAHLSHDPGGGRGSAGHARATPGEPA
jgi:hypothetical protein